MATFRDLLRDAKSRITETDPAGAEALLADGYLLLDVREPDEYDIAKIEGSILIPLSDWEAGIEKIDRNADIVVNCKMGGRSANAQGWMLENGYTKVLNMTGGITAWSNDVDSSIPIY